MARVLSLSDLSFRYPFRKYQALILNRVEATKDKDQKFHIVAPPGSGKTIVGLEIIKRFNAPAVIFAPTTTIALQWKEKIAMFLSDEDKPYLNSIVSTTNEKIAPINIYTYQLISSPSENLSFITDAAAIEWQEELVKQNIVPSLAAAKNRIHTLEKNNPAAYKKELSKYYKKLKSAYLKDPAFDGTQFLHPNAKKLIGDLITYGVRTIVMDESHHLLDYWAMVVKTLLSKIQNPILIGLTATPPLSADDEQLENYLSIMGEIDFEIPTPAVVKEGNLAPYQDLVYITSPTAKEKQFINSLETRFKNLIADIGNRSAFVSWIKSRILIRPLADGTTQDWTSFFNTHVYVAVAGVKYCMQVQKLEMPDDIVVLEDMRSDMTLDDWVYLLVDYALNFLKLSEDKTHHQELTDISTTLKSFGFVLTESGLRKLRSVTDAILAFSDSKNTALVKILQEEMKNIGKQLRAVVITDFEKQSVTVERSLRGILDADSGGAVRAFRAIVADALTTRLEAILVTGTTVLVDAHTLPTILAAMNAWKKEHKLSFTLIQKETQFPNIIELTGSGKDWKSNTYVRMVTHLFDSGVIRCMVGTRGLLGEGWDSLSLNTLIDLTQATTSMTVNQLRGRSIRLDPKHPQKLANNWDIVCIDTDFAKGDQDFGRFLDKHKHVWGLGTHGKIIKGFYHVDEKLGFEFQSLGFKRIQYALVNWRMLAKASQRAQAYKDWKIGEPYSNFEYTATKLDAKDIKFQTVYSLRDTLAKLFNTIVVGLLSFCAYYYYFLYQPIGTALETGNRMLLLILSTIFVIGIIGFSIKNVIKYLRLAFIDTPLDSQILAIAKALVVGLRLSKKIDGSQSVDNVRVAIDSGNIYDVYLDYASKVDAATFAQTFQEVLAPVTDQRYLLSRSIDWVNVGFYSPIWWFFRRAFRIFRSEEIAYHPVPTVLATKKEYAEFFATAWREYVGGGDLIYTRTEAGAQILLKLRRTNAHSIKRTSYEIWK